MKQKRPKSSPVKVGICEDFLIRRDKAGEQNCSLQKCSRADSFSNGILMYESKPKECVCTVGKKTHNT